MRCYYWKRISFSFLLFYFLPVNSLLCQCDSLCHSPSSFLPSFLLIPFPSNQIKSCVLGHAILPATQPTKTTTTTATATTTAREKNLKKNPNHNCNCSCNSNCNWNCNCDSLFLMERDLNGTANHHENKFETSSPTHLSRLHRQQHQHQQNPHQYANPQKPNSDDQAPAAAAASESEEDHRPHRSAEDALPLLPIINPTSSFSTTTTSSSSSSWDSVSFLGVLRESVRILRQEGTSVTAMAFAILCPVSAIALSDAFVSTSLARNLSVRLLLLSRPAHLPVDASTAFRVAQLLLSTLFCFPLYISISLLSKATLVLTVATSYQNHNFKNKLQLSFSAFQDVFVSSGIWKRSAFTYLLASILLSVVGILFFLALLVVCQILILFGAPLVLVVYPVAAVISLAVSVVFAHAVIVCNLAVVVSVLEEIAGFRAIKRAASLIQGQTQLGLLIFIGTTIGLAFVEGLFEYRVKTLSYGDGSSRIWEGPLLVVMYSFVVLIDSMMSAIFYFVCRSLSPSSLVEDEEEAKLPSSSSSVALTPI